MKPFYIFFISLTLFVVILLMYAAYLPYMPYKTDATVTEIEGDLITVTTEHGYMYQFYGTGFHKRDKIIISIDNKRDNDFNNDEVVDVKKIKR